MLSRLLGKHFQVAYVAESLDHAMSIFRDKYGIKQWQVLESGGPDSPAAGIATAYVDDLMLELIQPSDVPSIYKGWVSSETSPIRFHHLGFHVHSDEELKSAIRKFSDAGYADAYSGTIGNIIDWYYADCTADLGHYCELIHLKADGLGMFDNVPHN